jgi:hypothetical protein
LTEALELEFREAHFPGQQDSVVKAFERERIEARVSDGLALIIKLDQLKAMEAILFRPPVTGLMKGDLGDFEV